MAIRAAIDVGSNSVKLLVIDQDATGAYRILHDASKVTGLGKGLGPAGELDPRAARRTAECIAEFAATARSLDTTEILAAGTSALRRASDAAQFTARVAEQCGVAVTVISGEEEARLARIIALRELPGAAEHTLLFDVGGGSTELTLCHGLEVAAAQSLPLGARRITEEAGITHPVPPAAAERMAELVARGLAGAPGCAAVAPALTLAGLGGTATTMVWLMRGKRGEPAGDPHLAQVETGAVRALLAELASQTSDEVRRMPNLDPARADVIYGGIAIIAGLLAMYRAPGFTLVDRGLRFGLLLA
ncbi:hypothetical protein JW859_08205 [bacterium]|nr:hypothetical protein [bacterium]